jgi:ankyrin repeat protein
MRQLAIYYVLLAVFMHDGSILWAQTNNPAGTGIRDPRQARNDNFQFQDNQSTKEQLDVMGIKIAPAESQVPPPLLSEEELKGHLLLTIGNDDVEAISKLINDGVDINNSVTQNGMTPLMLCRSPAMVVSLLDNGAAINAKDNYGLTALHHHLFSERAEEILPLLLNAGANVKAVAAGSNNETPLLTARELFFEGRDPGRGEWIIRMLAHAGANLDAQDEMGYTILMTATVNNKPHLAQLALSLGADSDIKNMEGKTALSLARELGREEIEEILLDNKASY